MSGKLLSCSMKKPPRVVSTVDRTARSGKTRGESTSACSLLDRIVFEDDPILSHLFLSVLILLTRVGQRRFRGLSGKPQSLVQPLAQSPDSVEHVHPSGSPCPQASAHERLRERFGVGRIVQILIPREVRLRLLRISRRIRLCPLHLFVQGLILFGSAFLDRFKERRGVHCVQGSNVCLDFARALLQVTQRSLLLGDRLPQRLYLRECPTARVPERADHSRERESEQPCQRDQDDHAYES